MNFLGAHSILWFGKNSGLSLTEVYRYQPGYIEWLVLNAEDLVFDLKALESLPKATPFHYMPLSEVEKSSSLNGLTLKDKLKRQDLNPNFNVHQIKEMVANGYELAEVDYHFPLEVVKANKEKLKNLRWNAEYEDSTHRENHHLFDDQGVCPRCLQGPCMCSDPDPG